MCVRIQVSRFTFCSAFLVSTYICSNVSPLRLTEQKQTFRNVYVKFILQLVSACSNRVFSNRSRFFLHRALKMWDVRARRIGTKLELSQRIYKFACFIHLRVFISLMYVYIESSHALVFGEQYRKRRMEIKRERSLSWWISHFAFVSLCLSLSRTQKHTYTFNHKMNQLC